MGKWKGDSNPGGPGGTTRKIQTNTPRGKTSHKAGGGGGGDKGWKCCFAGQAVKAVWAGKFRLARRFARLDLKTRLGTL